MIGVERNKPDAIERLMADASEDIETLAAELDRLVERFRLLGGHSIAAHIDRVTTGLGFTRADMDKLCGEFSGGWRMRVMLAKLLLEKPSLLMLDEPNAFMDAEGEIAVVQAMEQARQRGATVIVIAHLRKRDLRYSPPMPTADDFHGSSDITKIPTKVVVLARAPRNDQAPPHLWGTYMQVLKERMDGFRPWIGVSGFDVRKREYLPEYRLGMFEDGEFPPDGLRTWLGQVRAGVRARALASLFKEAMDAGRRRDDLLVA